MTTYDELYTLFTTNYSSDGLFLPKTTEQQYNVIKNSVMLYNNRLRENLICDDSTETISGDVSDDKKLIIARFIRLTLLRNTRTFKNSMFDTFTKEIGVKNINSQLSSLKDDIETEENAISMLIFNMTDESIM